MNMFEEAKSLSVMMQMRNLSQKETAKMLDVSQSYIANKLRLLKLDEDLQNEILANGLSERHARALLRLSEIDDRKKALEKICNRRLSVAESEAMIDVMLMTELPHQFSGAKRLSTIDKFICMIKNSLNTIRALGTTATIKTDYENGKVYISICIYEKG